MKKQAELDRLYKRLVLIDNYFASVFPELKEFYKGSTEAITHAYEAKSLRALRVAERDSRGWIKNDLTKNQFEELMKILNESAEKEVFVESYTKEIGKIINRGQSVRRYWFSHWWRKFLERIRAGSDYWGTESFSACGVEW